MGKSHNFFSKMMIWLVRLVLLLVALTGSVIALMAIVLSFGPIESEFLKNQIRDRLEARLPDTTITMERASINWDDADGLQIRISHFQAISLDEVYSLEIDAIAVSSGSYSLNSISLTPKSVKLDAINLDIDISGKSLTTEAKNNESNALVQLERVGSFLSFVDGDIASLELEQLVFSNFNINIFNVKPNKTNSYQFHHGQLRRHDDGRLQLDFLAQGVRSNWPGKVVFSEKEKTGKAMLDVKITNSSALDISGNALNMRQGSVFRLPVNADIAAQFDKFGDTQSVVMNLSFGEGDVSIGDNSFLLHEAKARINWLKQNGFFELLSSTLKVGESRVKVKGKIYPPSAENRSWKFQLDSDEAIIKPADVSEPPLKLDTLNISGGLSEDLSKLNLDVIHLMADDASLDAAILLSRGNDGAILTLASQFDTMSVATLKRLWPFFVAPVSRDWVIKNIASGTIPQGRIDVGLRPEILDGSEDNLERDDVKLNIRLENADVKLIPRFPPLKQANGEIKIKRGHFSVALEQGSMSKETGKKLNFGASLFKIKNVLKGGNIADLNLKATGSVATLAQIVDLNNMPAFKMQNIRGENLSGQAELTLSSRFPLDEKTTLEEVDWKAHIHLKKFSSTQKIFDQIFYDGDLELEVTPQQMEIEGQLLVEDKLTHIQVAIPLDDGQLMPEGSLVLKLDAGKLFKGFNLAFAQMTGSLDVTIRLTENEQQYFDIDLKNTDINIRPLGWHKKKGVPAKLTFLREESEKGIYLQDIEFKSGKSLLKGKIDLNKNNQLVAVYFNPFRVHVNDKANLSIANRQGNLKILLKGEQFDLRPIIEQFNKPQETKTRSDNTPVKLAIIPDAGKGNLLGQGQEFSFSLSANIQRVIGMNKLSADKFRAGLSFRKGMINEASVNMQLVDKASFDLSLNEDENQNRRLEVQADGFGKILRFFDGYKNLADGVLTISADVKKDNSIVGDFWLKKFFITDKDTIDRLRNNVIAIARRRQIRDIENQYGEANFAYFDRLFSRFALDYDKKLLFLKNIKLSSPTVGVTADGEVDISRKLVNIRGTFLPIYGLNNALAKIPVLGTFFGGSEGGIIGVTFQVTESIKKPKVTYNPVSVIAPGVIRKIFEFRQ